MKSNSEIKYLIVLSISYITTLLFIYAATSKVIDFENFQVQIGQSPMLSAFASYLAYAVPVVELGIGILLINSRRRMMGLVLSFSLMVMFTAYIYIILNYSSFVPCSCGGLLEELSWNQHIIFNLVFVALTAIAIYCTESVSVFFKNGIRKSAVIITVALLSYYLVYSLFLWSEKIMQYQNTFIRRFPHFPAVLQKEVQLSSDNYYFAGGDTNKLYLGDFTAPLKILEITKDGYQKRISVNINHKNIPFTSIQIKINPPDFFLVDGNVPAVFHGNIIDWHAKYKMKGKSFFSTVEPVNASSLLMRATLKSTRTNALGRIDLKDSINVSFAPNLIQKQLDGVFDTDGQLHYDKYDKQVVYVYSYRNEYIVADSRLNLIHRGNTIDTISQAKLKVVTVQSNGETKLAAPPLIVNKTSALHRNLLFVNSQLAGQFESLEMWRNASIIDVYDVNTKKYIFSFYIYDINKKKVKNLFVMGNLLYALIDDKLVVYKLSTSITKNYKLNI